VTTPDHEGNPNGMPSPGETREDQAPGITTGIGLKLIVAAAVFLALWIGHFSVGHYVRGGVQQLAEATQLAAELRALGYRLSYQVADGATAPATLHRSTRDFDNTLARLQRLDVSVLSASERQRFNDQLQQLTAAWRPVRQALGVLSDTEASTDVASEARDLFDIQATQLRYAIDATAQRSGEIQLAAHDRLSFIRNGLYLLGLILLVALSAAAYHRIVLPLRQLVIATRRMGDGDHSVRVPVTGDDEVGELTAAFNAANEQTARLVSRLRSGTTRLRREAQRHRNILNSVADAIVTVDESGRITLANDKAENLFGYRRDELIGQPVDMLVPASTRPHHANLLRGYFDSPQAREMGSGLDVEGLHRDGRRIPLDISLSPYRLGRRRGAIAVVRDVTAQRQAAALSARLTAILNNTSDLVAILHPDGRFWYLNPAGRKLLGLEADADLSEQRLCDYMPAWARRVAAEPALGRVQRTGTATVEAALRRFDGAEVPVSQLFIAHHDTDGTLTFVSTICRDISERKRHESELRHQATHDRLTGLANRTLAEDRLRQSISRAHRHGRSAAVLFIDLDNFKYVNDTLGHAAGDTLLRAVAGRLRDSVRDDDTVARQGGDEFAVMLHDLDGVDDARRVADKLMQRLGDPINLGRRSLRVTASIGISVYPQHGETPETLLMRADAAMFRAKREGRNAVCVYEASLTVEAEERLDLGQGLREAIDKGEIALAYQPIARVDDGALAGCEALARWRHPTLGTLSAERFIDVAEESGQIHAIGRQVIAQACQQLSQWRRTRLAIPSLSVNISERQLRDPNLVQTIVSAIRDAGIPAESIELDITESALLHHPETAQDSLAALKAAGVGLAVDDFGSGYSSLTHLRLFRFDRLKIDRQFTREIDTDPQSAAIVRGIAAIGHALGATVLAEGIERAAQIPYLAEAGCDEIQGFAVSAPLDPAAMANWLRGRKHKASG
jgi:diguanylate cyclase (GGDEF)-like protein/PAS domain S-box-containing protein